jgi:hypothetical protein
VCGGDGGAEEAGDGAGDGAGGGTGAAGSSKCCAASLGVGVGILSLKENKNVHISNHSTVKSVKLLMSLSYTKWVHFKVSNVIVRDDFLVSRHIYMYMSCTM